MNETLTIEVGMGVTHCVGSDRYPYTVVSVVNDRTLYITKDSYKAVRKTISDPNSFKNEWEYTSNFDDDPIVITKRKNNMWYHRGDTMTGCPFFIGQRRVYFDPHF